MNKPTNTYATKIVDLNKDLISGALDKTQNVAEKTVDYNRDILLAGLGAFADVRTEGKQVFDKLVSRGEELENKTRAKLDEQSAKAKEKIVAAFDKVSSTTVSLDRPKAKVSLEDLFDTRVARSIKRLGIPTSELINKITDQLKDISIKLNELAEDGKKEIVAKVAEIKAA
jgi:poly(hydroxyalkanoate) granule-associated protein